MPYSVTSSEQFIIYCKKILVDYINEHLDKSDNTPEVTENDVYVVWHSFILGNQKCLMSSTLPDSMYYEITYDRDADKIYFDAYKKFENRCYEVKC